MQYNDFLSRIPMITFWIILFIFLDLFLRGMALWRAAKRSQKWWFVALLIINSVGILPTIYLLTHPEKRGSKK
ncbi:hypothetical protein A2W13_01375 [Candidatus Woesebacteria bacterium RBG_16_36_11]|uniref:DUF5652 domain-containing protein n=3 Tax=Candidatus Woeseibacteriota TaxID=1752722 RepID=A0A1F7XCZ2_9BACT|nr:MAG: hypothetical protein A2Z67_03380 [Candidatus Woesebacteria bacterium RBG_13_36_22]OGM12278.1 MAG: hypothetical protein A2W13_01375 [Candidatus Woesebacteria bacterium RBG_16_36_11]OGM16304.1 MAG: hypothetical protein A2V55_01140 [Candidatus Woesebacteria bacterium RBG_19FT_COMBO_37_29]